MQVLLCRTEKVPETLLEAVRKALSAVPGPIGFQTSRQSVRLEPHPNGVEWDEIFTACASHRKVQALPECDFLMLLMDDVNSQNWFSACDPSGKPTAFVHTADWDYYLPCDPEHAIAFEVVANLLQYLTFSVDSGTDVPGHDPPIGCINDMCSWKPDIILKARTADVCMDCERMIADRALDPGTIAQLYGFLENLRPKMLFRKYQDPAPDTVQLPFPIAITRRKMSATAEPFRKFHMLIDHFDSLVRCAVLSCGCISLGEDFHEFYERHELSGRPSLGHWVAALRELSAEEYAGLGVLKDDQFECIRTVVERAEDAEVVRVRNDTRGHGYCDCHDSSYDNRFAELKPTVLEIEELLRPVLTMKWYFTVTLQNLRDEGLIVTAKALIGDHPEFDECDVPCHHTAGEPIPQTGEVYAVTQAGKWHKLSPYVRYCHCPECDHPRVLVVDGELYLDPYVGHRFMMGDG